MNFSKLVIFIFQVGLTEIRLGNKTDDSRMMIFRNKCNFNS